jgi:hypothetical protein
MNIVHVINCLSRSSIARILKMIGAN